MVTTTGLALFSLAVIILTRIYVSFNPPDFLRPYRDLDGNYCGSNYCSSPFRRKYHLRPQISSESPDNSEGQGQDGNEKKEEHGHEKEVKRNTSRPLPGHAGGESARDRMGYPSRHTAQAIPRPRAATTAATFTSKQQDRTVDDDKLAIVHHLRNPSSSTSDSHHFHTSLPSIPTIIPTAQPHRQWLDLDISNIHYHGSLGPFGTDDEVLKTIQVLQTGFSSNSNSNSGGGYSAFEYARTRGMTVVWEDAQWCCLEGRTLYILKAIGWTGQVRARVLVDQSAGATL
ncbi:hypothetical protein KI688_005604 [Linnemannia hyalina]|uniref:Uncharacterized protein n=1 Tax=Linnemannia hyalina TaxID=64524 RepID=A0A9P8BXJ8_9FUNG|nr:hypothetical protein KI688_005604 [Linnemannia hyalina]